MKKKTIVTIAIKMKT